MEETSPNEVVTLHHDKRLSCGPDGTEARAQYRVRPGPGVGGSQVDVTVVTSQGEFTGSGALGEKVTVDFTVPAPL